MSALTFDILDYRFLFFILIDNCEGGVRPELGNAHLLLLIADRTM